MIVRVLWRCADKMKGLLNLRGGMRCSSAYFLSYFGLKRRCYHRRNHIKSMIVSTDHRIREMGISPHSQMLRFLRFWYFSVNAHSLVVRVVIKKGYSTLTVFWVDLSPITR